MRAVFLGTPAAAVPSLAALLDVADVALVVTRPDSPKGRSARATPPPVKLAAAEWGLPIAQPAAAAALLASLRGVEADVGVVVAYGRILRPEALASTRVGFVNVHFSLLPRWRGAAPVERAILAGDEMGGVSLMQLDEEMDTGPIISVIETPIEDDETGGTLTARLSHLGALLLAEALPEFMRGVLHPAQQMSSGATHATPLSTDEARLDPEASTAELLRRVRAFNPRPGAWFLAAETRFKVWSARPSDIAGEPGVVSSSGGVVVLGAADGALELDVIQPPGAKPMAAADWMHGRRGEALPLDTTQVPG